MSPETSDNRGAHWLAVATRMRGRAERAEDAEMKLIRGIEEVLLDPLLPPHWGGRLREVLQAAKEG